MGSVDLDFRQQGRHRVGRAFFLARLEVWEDSLCQNQGAFTLRCLIASLRFLTSGAFDDDNDTTTTTGPLRRPRTGILQAFITVRYPRQNGFE